MYQKAADRAIADGLPHYITIKNCFPLEKQSS
jgi:hypothetical protein